MMNDGELLKVRGMIRAKCAEEEDNPGFTERALCAIHDVAINNAEVHIDTLSRSFQEQAVHVNCWGSIWRKAQVLGWIVPTGEWRKAEVVAIKHARRYPIYKSLVHARPGA